MMPPELIKYLSDKEPAGDFHTDFLKHCKELVDMSRRKMEENYDRWDSYHEMWKGQKTRDLQDAKAGDRKEPEKMVIPVTYSQIETFVSFCQQVYTQRPHIFELGGVGVEDIQAAKVAEDVLEYNLQFNTFKGDKLPQFLRNIGKFGLGILKDCWHEEFRKVEQMVPMEVQQVPGQPPAAPILVPQMTNQIAYQGNKILAVSPYRFFPDPRLPLTQFQDGEFCASDDTYSLNQLKKMAGQGLVAGIEHVDAFKNDINTTTKRRYGYGIDPNIDNPGVTKANSVSNFEVTEVVIEIIPADWVIEGTMKLGESTEPTKYVVWYANDNRIIRIEPFNYLHDRFPYSVSQFTNDNLQYINGGLGEILAQLQDVQNWLINSHITSVRKVISNMMIVDPKGVDMSDLENRRPIIRLKPAAQNSGVDRWIKQLSVNDVTQNHISDIGVLAGYAKEATGITENLLGQFASGRRSATEARNVSSNAAARLLLTAVSIWEVALLPLARRLLSNCRDGMEVPQLIKVLGESNFMENQAGVQQFIKADKTQLIGEYDFMLFDGTLPSQRGAVAQVLQELLGIMMAKPETALVFQMNPVAILNEMLTLRGIRNISQFRLNPQQAQELIGMAQFARNATATVNSTGAGGPAPAGGPPQSTG